MQLTPEITFRGLASTPAVENKIQERIARLERYYSRIMGCRVMLELNHRHQHKGKLFYVRLEVTVPGRKLVVSRDPEAHQAREDVYVAIRDAFDAMERRLEDFARRQRGDIKMHESPDRGVISELAAESGRIDTTNGRSIYFHRNSVAHDGFEGLAIGTAVEYVEASGEEGPQASMVVALGKRDSA